MVASTGRPTDRLSRALYDVGMAGAEPVTTPDDPSQLPIEQLAQLLLECARGNAVLPRRTPANDDVRHACSIDDMYDRIEALPELHREPPATYDDPHSSLPMLPAADVASNEELEELVASAVASAQDAEDIAREAHAASRRARRGMFLAVGLAAVGVVIAGAAVIGAQQYSVDTQQMAEIARQVRTLRDLQHHINEQLAQAQRPVEEAGAAQRSVQEASAAPAQPSVAPPSLAINASQPALAPVKTMPVRVLPAEPAAPLAAAQPFRTSAGPASYAQAASYAGYSGYAAYASSPAPAYVPPAVYEGPWTPYRRRVRRYPVRVVLPWPVARVVVSMRRDVRTLFR